MRNQSWLQDGTLVKDEETYYSEAVHKYMLYDHLHDELRAATEDEIAAFIAATTEPRDTLKELDDLKAEVELMKTDIAALKTAKEV